MARIRKTAEETVEFLKEENLIKVTVPIRIFHRGGKATIETPDGMIGHEDMVALQRALIQGHRWIKMLESGRFRTMEGLAKREKTDKSRVAKLVRMTCIAPDIQEAILCNTGKWVLSLKDCMKPFPMLWSEQYEHFTMVAAISPRSLSN